MEVLSENSVIDRGVGMTPETIDKILQGNRQDSSRGTAGEVGFGIGMSICIELIKALGGKLAIESEPEKGSKVTVVFPTIPQPRQQFFPTTH